jgi:hypothetical protein
MNELFEALQKKDPLFLKRIENAKKWGSADELIAGAMVVKDKLVVLSCELIRYEIYFDDIATATPIAAKDRESFCLDVDGSFLYWEKSDTHLDLEYFCHIGRRKNNERTKPRRLP